MKSMRSTRRDRSIRYPKGLIEDVTINIEGCYFLVDFSVLEMTSPKNLKESAIILGQIFENPSHEPIVLPLNAHNNLDRKPLSDNLKFTFLGPNDTMPTIIASHLTSNEESKLLSFLKEYKGTLGWHMSNLKGISLDICMHKKN
ncbi:unnamed protein product [Spirodela intermedia]|uniref:Uncharacterized protein n=1 Tax=Spirodela intermedia TaxID=51605 RepID=A0A7I8LJ96_SPIIN|nr:unnamed protein product [Spirodela intermedia]